VVIDIDVSKDQLLRVKSSYMRPADCLSFCATARRRLVWVAPGAARCSS